MKSRISVCTFCCCCCCCVFVCIVWLDNLFLLASTFSVGWLLLLLLPRLRMCNGSASIHTHIRAMSFFFIRSLPICVYICIYLSKIFVLVTAFFSLSHTSSGFVVYCRLSASLVCCVYIFGGSVVTIPNVNVRLYLFCSLYIHDCCSCAWANVDASMYLCWWS